MLKKIAVAEATREKEDGEERGGAKGEGWIGRWRRFVAGGVELGEPGDEGRYFFLNNTIFLLIFINITLGKFFSKIIHRPPAAGRLGLVGPQ